MFLQVCKGADQAEGFALILEDFVVVSAGHNEDIVFFEVFVGVVVGGVRAEGGATAGHDVVAGANEFAVKGFVFCLHR